jgi:hypothetical protein
MRKTAFFAPILSVILLAGCATLQPSVSKKSAVGDLPWDSYDKFVSDAKKIVLYETTLQELIALGFDPKLPNAKKIKDVRTKLLPRPFDSVETLRPGARECYQNFTECPGYTFPVEKVFSQGRGSVILRLINVKKEDVVTGWEADLDIYLLARKYIAYKYDVPLTEQFENELVVIFMLDSGIPNIQQVIVEKSPLGFIDPLTGMGKKVSPYGSPNFNTD